MKKQMKEEWRPIRGFEDCAEISNYGQIHRFRREYYCGKNHQTKHIQEEDWTYGSENGKGYLKVSIGNKSFRVNRLVYMTFVGGIPKGMEVNHLDEDKHNNRLDNLNLLSHGDNMRYGTGIARLAAALTNNPKKSKAVQAFNKNGDVVYEFPSSAEAERQGFGAGAVSKCCRNCYSRPGNNVYKGFIWRYKENAQV